MRYVVLEPHPNLTPTALCCPPKHQDLSSDLLLGVAGLRMNDKLRLSTCEWHAFNVSAVVYVYELAVLDDHSPSFQTSPLCAFVLLHEPRNDLRIYHLHHIVCFNISLPDAVTHHLIYLESIHLS